MLVDPELTGVFIRRNALRLLTPYRRVTVQSGYSRVLCRFNYSVWFNFNS
ncbi:hypothetical protein NNRS527_02564 [Nitrosospira sp. NRS527]|nr:hypothetical protein NNRS527_02564 [Nitrosospira sp. NRS527]